MHGPGTAKLFNQRIKAWIASTGVTQSALAERIGRNQAWMSRYLAGEFAADLETLQKMARAFNHSLAALLESPTDPDEAKLIEAYRALSPPRARYRVGPLRGLGPIPWTRALSAIT